MSGVRVYVWDPGCSWVCAWGTGVCSCVLCVSRRKIRET